MVESALMTIQGVCQAFGGQQVLQNVSADIYPGQIILLRGQNGSGKTTLINIMTGGLSADRGTLSVQTDDRSLVVNFPQRTWQKANPWQRFTVASFATLGIVRAWQDGRLFRTQSLINNIAVATRGQAGENPLVALVQRERVRRQERDNLRSARGLLEDLGLGDRTGSSADRVSLGQAKRVAIGRTLQAGVKILFLDEPLAGLDAAGIAEVLRLLKQLVQARRVTLVIVEHLVNLPMVLDLATVVWTLEQGRLRVESPETVRAELKVESLSVEERCLQEFAGKGDIERLRLPGGALLSIVRSMAGNRGIPLLEVEDLKVRRGQRWVLGTEMESGISFRLWRGDFAVLQAPNGWGKTSLLEAIAGIIPVSQGTIRLAGSSIDGLPIWERVKRGLSFLQSRNNTFQSLTVEETFRVCGVNLVPEGIRMLLLKRVANLSGGERQRVLLGCHQSKTSVIQLYDEPFLALDGVGLDCVKEMIQPSVDRVCLVAVPAAVLEDGV